MAKPNYQFEKRQRDLAKKRKKEEKLRAKQAGKSPGSDDGTATDDEDTPADAEAGTAPEQASRDGEAPAAS